MTSNCTICGRALDTNEDPLSGNCGGDCWGCIGEMEADGCYEPSLEQVRKEFKKGYRPDWVPSPEVSLSSNEKIKSGVDVKILITLTRPLGEPWANKEVIIRYISMSSDGLKEKKEIDQFVEASDKGGKISLIFNYPRLWFGDKAWIQINLKSHIWSFPLFKSRN